MAGRPWIIVKGLILFAIAAGASFADDPGKPSAGEETWFEEQATDFATPAGGQVWGIAFSKDGSRLATASGSDRGRSNGPGELAIIDVSGRNRVAFEKSTSGLKAVA